MGPPKANAELRQLARGLQDDLAMIDMLTRPSRGGHVEFLIKKLKHIRLTMDADLNHVRPHIHMDYGREFHGASFAIDTGARIVGSSPTKYDKRIQLWIEDNREKLMEVWAGVRSGRDVQPLVVELKESGE